MLECPEWGRVWHPLIDEFGGPALASASCRGFLNDACDDNAFAFEVVGTNPFGKRLVMDSDKKGGGSLLDHLLGRPRPAPADRD